MGSVSSIDAEQADKRHMQHIEYKAADICSDIIEGNNDGINYVYRYTCLYVGKAPLSKLAKDIIDRYIKEDKSPRGNPNYSYFYSKICDRLYGPLHPFTTTYAMTSEVLGDRICIENDIYTEPTTTDISANYTKMNRVNYRARRTCNGIVESFKRAQSMGLDNYKNYNIEYSCDDHFNNKYIKLIKKEKSDL